MTSLLIAMLLVSNGPELDLIDGVTIVPNEREWLPSGRDLSSIADVWLVQVVNQQVSGSGIARFDPIRLGFHGSSWTQTRFLLNGLEITDPARSGSPLLELPYGAWDRLEFRYQLSEKPGFNTVYSSRNKKDAFVGGLRWGMPVGGGTWVPQGLMDREPATFHGATSTRRVLNEALEGDIELSYGDDEWGLHLGAERYEHTHQYPTFVDKSGNLLSDRGIRTAAVGSAHGSFLGRPLDFVTAWQSHQRTHAGSQLRWPLAHTKAVDEEAWVAQAIWDANPLSIKAGFGWASDDQERNSRQAFVRDLEEEWMWLERFRDAESSKRWRVDADLGWKLEPFVSWSDGAEIGLVMHHVQLKNRPNWGSSLEGVTYLRGATTEAQSVSMTQWETPVMEHWWQGVRPKFNSSGTGNGIRWKGDLGLDLVELGVPSETLLRQWEFVAGLTLEKSIAGFDVFGRARREPEELTAELARFLDPNSPHGLERAWSDDNGDRLPSADEAGAIKRRSGGRYHSVDPYLTRPTRNLFSLGFKSPRFGHFIFVLTTHFRWLKDKYIVRYDPKTKVEYTSSSIEDPGESDTQLTVYDREVGSEGEETYQLTNASRSDFFFGTELQLKTEGVSGWFLNLSASGYLSQGSGVFGSFPDRNDSGILHEIAAEPNSRINQRGRYDNDRAFGVNLLAGIEPLENLRLALAGRYRDGEPMTRYFVTELSQGPTPIMAVERGAPIPRHTFHLTMDTRISYSFVWAGWNATASLDCFNLLGSGTELLEDIRTGDSWRKSLEMVPGRTILAALKLSH
uniref:TonB-dependent receptor-like beta-barrel domain-containing protein n=1 Tax=uncultured myxobacterium HF0200_19H16 TaxID=723559 RepID=E7C3V7_9BACT|nr:hypothetical protein [uncultured myxobacterium HF0200_19H16]